MAYSCLATEYAVDKTIDRHMYQELFSEKNDLSNIKWHDFDLKHSGQG